MASVRNLKKDLNNTYGAIIDGALIHQVSAPKEDQNKSEALIEDVITDFDQIILEINKKDVENRSKHLKSVNHKMEENANQFIERLNSL